ncbi:MAG: CobW family GTP-binding protein [Pseudomonadota bacterium]
MIDRPPLPLTLVGGYLGSGKTTLVNHLLRHAGGMRFAILVNEFGSLSIDSDLIEAESDTMISLAGGCVCCSYGNDMMLALTEIDRLQPRPDHIILEASGVALPGAIASTLSLVQTIDLEGILVLVDAANIRDQAENVYVGDTVRRQIQDADILLVNKIDLVSPAERGALHEWLRSLNGAAGLIDAEHGKIDLSAVLGHRLHASNRIRRAAVAHSVPFETVALAFDRPVDPAHLGRQLTLNHPEIVRAKGFVDAPDGRRWTLHVVGGRWQVSEAPPCVQAQFVVIGIGPLNVDMLCRRLGGRLPIEN